VQAEVRSEMRCPLSLRRVCFVKARTVLRRLRAVWSSCDMVWSGASVVPAVRLPSQRIMLWWLVVAVMVWSQRSSSVPILADMWLRLGAEPAWLFGVCEKEYWRNNR